MLTMESSLFRFSVAFAFACVVTISRNSDKQAEAHLVTSAARRVPSGKLSLTSLVIVAAGKEVDASLVDCPAEMGSSSSASDMQPAVMRGARLTSADRPAPARTNFCFSH